MIKRIHISNYRILRSFDMECQEGLNILVGDNESGKSTILEAIHLALTRKLNGRQVDYELSPYLFNEDVAKEYLTAVQHGENPDLPRILIEVYLDGDDPSPLLRGQNNSRGEDCRGVKLEISFDEEYREEYRDLLENRAEIRLIPTEYFHVSWQSFANANLTSRRAPVGVQLIDATSIRLQSGHDYYIQSLVNSGLDPKERVGLAISYRKLKEHFAEQPQIKAINSKLTKRQGPISGKDLLVTMDVSQRTSWETNLTPHLDELPFQFVGKGEQNAVKILLALDRDRQGNDVVLIEEPENHLSHASMSMLVGRIQAECEGKQLFIATHSAYVLNKLGIENVALVHGGKAMFLSAVSEETQRYFRRLSGYDTLRLILAQRAILVEGPSDELIVQRAYRTRHEGRLPLADGIDVINVRGLSFARFLELSNLLGKETHVVTDNDGDFMKNVSERYAAYTEAPHIKVHASPDNNLPSLEQQIVAVNEIDVLNRALGTSHADADALLKYMSAPQNKAECALRLFDTTEDIIMPDYIWNAAA